MISRLSALAAQAAATPHGGKEALYAAACAELALSRATLLRYLKQVTVQQTARKQRADAGASQLDEREAIILSGFLTVATRRNGKRLMSIPQALETLRKNGEIRAVGVDKATGECRPLSPSTVARALRNYGLHPDQLLRPEPAKELKSLHPNHVWQIDASLCVLYYLVGVIGLQVMERDEFYKNKPKNLARIAADRVWSYEITDHYSGSIFVFYVMGSESAANLAESFIRCITNQGNGLFHGVPLILYMDMGSANTSGLFKNLARRLQVQTLAHMPGVARATGQVENARNIIEKSFESGLSYCTVRDLDELNERARQWCVWFNSTQKHSRYGKARHELWQTITADQLRVAPSAELCRALLTHEPETRKVSDFLTISFNGRDYDVAAIPRVMVGEKLKITWNPYDLESALVVDVDANGRELLIRIPVIERDEAGFRVEGANVIGEDYSRHASTRADENRKAVELAAMGVSTLVEAKAARKARVLPFGGRIDPWKVAAEADLPTWLPKRGTALEVATQTTIAEKTLNHFEAARALVARGVAMDADKNRRVAEWYPAGVPETELAALAGRLADMPCLKLVAN
ncbi:MAG: transposase [Zoogloeaceae bacterium]|nr:transposase [Zoogloeaceae bacterium]